MTQRLRLELKQPESALPAAREQIAQLEETIALTRNHPVSSRNVRGSKRRRRTSRWPKPSSIDLARALRGGFDEASIRVAAPVASAQ